MKKEQRSHLDKTITRQAIHAYEAAFMLGISENEFVPRFVATKKIKPVAYDEFTNEFKYDIDDVVNIVKTHKLELPDEFLDKLARGISITDAIKQWRGRG